jgi:hypothetical protein
MHPHLQPETRRKSSRQNLVYAKMRRHWLAGFSYLLLVYLNDVAGLASEQCTAESIADLEAELERDTTNTSNAFRLLAIHSHVGNMEGCFDVFDIIVRVALSSTPPKIGVAARAVELAGNMAREQPTWSWHEVASILILATQRAGGSGHVQLANFLARERYKQNFAVYPASKAVPALQDVASRASAKDKVYYHQTSKLKLQHDLEQMEYLVAQPDISDKQRQEFGGMAAGE